MQANRQFASAVNADERCEMFFIKYKRSPAIFEFGFRLENQPRPGFQRSEMSELFHIMLARELIFPLLLPAGWV